MRRKSRISFGPGAASLILIMVVLTMSVLGILSLMSARSDMSLTRRSAEVIRAGYVLSAQAEKTAATLDTLAVHARTRSVDELAYLDAIRAGLPRDIELEDRQIVWEESDGLRTLECALEVLPMTDEARLRWTTHRLTAVTEDLWN